MLVLLQATEVVLHHLPVVTDTMTQLMRGLVPTSQAVLMKLMKASQPPEVELFRRIQPNNMLISVNNTLENDPRIKEECDIARQGLATIVPKHRAPQGKSRVHSANPNESLLVDVLGQFVMSIPFRIKSLFLFRGQRELLSNGGLQVPE